MSDVTILQQQLDAELAGAAQRVQQSRKEWQRFGEEREARLKKVDAVLERLVPVWKPRLELLRDRFAKFAQAKPLVTPYARSVTFTFESKFKVELKFSADADHDARNVVLDYDLLIIPILTDYRRHDRLEVPIDQVDEQAVGRWFDERIMEFVRTYIALQGDDFVEQKLTSK